GMVQRIAARLPRGRVPEPGGFVLAARQEGPAVGAEGHSLDVPLVPQRLAEELPGRWSQEPRFVTACRENDRAVRAQGPPGELLCQRRPQGFPRGHLPGLENVGLGQPELSGETTGRWTLGTDQQDNLPVAADAAYPQVLALIRAWWAAGLPGARLPQLQGPVIAVPQERARPVSLRHD